MIRNHHLYSVEKTVGALLIVASACRRLAWGKAIEVSVKRVENTMNLPVNRGINNQMRCKS